jgi:hypothetical protein
VIKKVVDKPAQVWYGWFMDNNSETILELFTVDATGPGWTESFEVIARGRDHACFLAHASILNYLNLPSTTDLGLIDVHIAVDTCLYPEDPAELSVADNDLTWE